MSEMDIVTIMQHMVENITLLIANTMAVTAVKQQIQTMEIPMAMIAVIRSQAQMMIQLQPNYHRRHHYHPQQQQQLDSHGRRVQLMIQHQIMESVKYKIQAGLVMVFVIRWVNIILQIADMMAVIAVLIRILLSASIQA
jgi:hypothetical protein